MGSLVRWTEGEAYGEVTGIDDGAINVRWDRRDAPSRFAASNPPLLRVEFAAGHDVLLNSTNESAVVLELVTAEPPVWRLLVTGPPQRRPAVPEAALRPSSTPETVNVARERHSQFEWDDSPFGRLKRTGTIVRRCNESPLDVLGKTLLADAKILDALLEERSEERDEGQR